MAGLIWLGVMMMHLSGSKIQWYNCVDACTIFSLLKAEPLGIM